LWKREFLNIILEDVRENSPYIRENCCRGLHKLGIGIDSETNNKSGKEIREISLVINEVRIIVVPANEELKIAQDTEKVIEKILT
jgi:acetate kinase